MYVEKYQFMKNEDLGNVEVWKSAAIDGIQGRRNIIGAMIHIVCATGAGTLTNIDYYFTLPGAPLNDTASSGQPTTWWAAAAAMGAEGTLVGTTHRISHAVVNSGLPLQELEQLILIVTNDATPKTGCNGWISLVYV